MLKQSPSHTDKTVTELFFELLLTLNIIQCMTRQYLHTLR